MAVAVRVGCTLVAASCSLTTALDDLTRPDAGTDGSSDAATHADVSEAEAGAPAYVAAVLADHPIAYYRFEELTGSTAHDSSGNGLDAVYGVDVVRGVKGLVAGGYAVQFDGDLDGGFDHFVHLAPSMQLEPTQAMSIEFWERSLTNNGANLVSYGEDDNPPWEPWVMWVETTGTANVYFALPADSGVLLTAPGSFGLGEVHFLAATYDGEEVRLYVDGSPLATSAATGPISNYDLRNGLGIGNGGEGTRQVCDCVLDEVAIFGSALAPARIAAHYMAGLP